MLLAPSPTNPHLKIPISRPFFLFLWNQIASSSVSSRQSEHHHKPPSSTNSLMASPALGAGAPPFLIKTYAMVDDPETDDTISWTESGTSFVVWRRTEFERDLLPKNFKHSNFASFVRQLNTYGFRKIGMDRWEFANECFRRGEKGLLGAIQRRKGSGVGAAPASPMIATAIPISFAPTPTSSGGDPAVSSSPPPPTGPAAAVSGAVAELEEENARLRRENARLARELARARRVCDGVRHLVARYDHGGEEAGEEEEDERQGAAAGGKPMLFGVAIGGKRPREDWHVGGDGENGAEEDDDEEREDDHDDDDARRGQGKSARTERSDLNALSLYVRAAAAARPDGGSRDRSGNQTTRTKIV